jgi:hypothetical protein
MYLRLCVEKDEELLFIISLEQNLEPGFNLGVNLQIYAQYKSRGAQSKLLAALSSSSSS